MSRAYRFRLASLLRLRRAELEVAEASLADANARLRARIAARADALAHCTELAGAPPAASVEAFVAARHEADLAARAFVAIDGQINVAAAQAALAQAAWSSAHRRVAALERLEEHRREEWRAEAARAEANDLDELATAAFVRDSLARAAVGR